MDKIYKKGYVYKMYSDEDNKYYIGSTVCTLRRRLQSHKCVRQREEYAMRTVIVWMNSHELSSLHTIALKEYEDITRKQLYEYEHEEIMKHINTDLCLNTYAVRRSKARLAEQKRRTYLANRQHYIQKTAERGKRDIESKRNHGKLYRERHKKVIAVKHAGKIECHFCGTIISRGNFSMHTKSQKCQGIQSIYNFIYS